MFVILIFGFVTLYMGYCRETGEDSWGTSLSHFLWLYMIARYIKLYVSIDSIRKYCWLWIAGFAVSSGLTFGLAILEGRYALPHFLWAYPYCSPWVLTGAISLLLFALIRALFIALFILILFNSSSLIKLFFIKIFLFIGWY